MIRIFTDGACSGNPGPGGWAFVVNAEEEVKVYSGGNSNTTNNRMELNAVLKALTFVVKKGIKDVEIVSDSSYVLNAITKHWLENWRMNGWKTAKKEEVKNTDIWLDVHKMLSSMRANKFKIKWTKIKGHSGNTFNEMADKAAKKEVEKIIKAERL